MIEIIQELLKLLRIKMSDKIVTFYTGEVAVVPKHKCPAVMVYPINSTRTRRSTSSDNVVATIGIKVIDLLQNYIEVDGDMDTIKAQKGLVEVMEKMGTDNMLADDTILGVISAQANTRGTNYIFTDEMSIDYSIIQQGEFFYVSASMTLQANNIVQRKA